MAFPTSETLEALISPLVASHHLDVEGIKVNRAGKKSSVTIQLDGDQRPGLDLLEVVSQEISELFDATEERGTLNFGAGYTLEVTTPGVDRPLTLPRHWRRNRGRLVKVTQDEKQSTWRIGALDKEEARVVLVQKQGRNLVVESLVLANTPRAVVEIEFAQAPEEQLELTNMSYDEAMQWREDHA
ncbi:ribosome maturation factor RimP [Corynebacterium gerontici]|nr:ribosome maturation factor RimP [Corynebacterium gerontici]